MDFFKQLSKLIVSSILSLEARLILKKYHPKIVVIVGSVGKTSTKDAIYTALSKFFLVRKSEKSFNSDIGLPLTILGVHNPWYNPLGWLKIFIDGALLILFPHPYPEWLVLELGADRPGDIKSILKWLTPDIAVGTRFPHIPVHVEFFKSPQALIEEDSLVFEALSRDGVAILNFNDEEMMARRADIAQQVLTYGLTPDADIAGSNAQILYHEEKKLDPVGMTFKIDAEGSSMPIRIFGALGKQHIFPVLAALAVVASQKLNLVKAAEAFETHRPPQGRMNIIEGLKETTIIDDSYNASPIAVEEALETLKDLTVSGRRIVMLADMMELGRYSATQHKQIGEKAAAIADIIVTVGVRARGIAEGALGKEFKEDSIFQFEKSDEAGNFIQNLLQKGDVILIKGSESMRMERAVKAIMAHPEYAEDLLVRQNKEWLEKI